jgi:serine/threonine-protein kinase
MTDSLLVNKASATPSTDTRGSGASITLPPELLAEASRRLGWLGLVYACTYALAYWGQQLSAVYTDVEHSYGRAQDLTAMASIALGFSVFALSRTARVSPQAFLDFGLIFAVVGSFGISIAEFSRGFLTAPLPIGRYLGVPWECVWIILFPLIAPNTPRKILLASLGSATTGPLTLFVVHRVGGVELNASPTRLVLYFLFSVYLCAALAFVISKVIVRYGVKLKKAREVGSYELVREIGQGGMGEVWVARHRLLARPAAVKLIRPGLLGADERSRITACRRFEREAQATAALGSKHTVDIYDFGITDHGAFFYVMELLDGLSLEALVKRFGPIGPARAVFLLRQVCHSLDEAHARGMIHRDIKPANIFTCRLGPDYDFVKVLDFGLVKRSRDVQTSMELTGAGSTAGTPAYMAPEMAVDAPDLDGRADLYALGCVAYWLLTGGHVFDADTPVGTILKHVREEPMPPSRRTELCIPAALEAVILSCLAKDPADRPQTASELSFRLQASLGEDPWTAYDAREWWERHLPAPSDRSAA